MDSPRQGFRRAAVASWALVGVGIAGVTGMSALAYADTFKPAADVPSDVSVSEPEPVQAPTEPVPPPPDFASTTDAPPPPPVPEPTAPEYTPTYTPEPTVERAPAPVTREAPAPAPSTPPTTKRRNATPTTVMAPNYSPHITVSRGS
jgi:protein TonB